MSNLSTPDVEAGERNSLEEHSFETDKHNTADISNSTIDKAVFSPPPQDSNPTDITTRRYSFSLSDPSPSLSADRHTMDFDSGKGKCLVTLFGILLLLPIILVPMSFSDLQYYEMGLKKSTVTGSVDTSEVYFSGRHFIGPDKTFKVFQANSHLLLFRQLSIFSDDKIEVLLSCALQYKLRVEDLHLLHDAYDVNYKPVLEKTALASIKNKAGTYSIEEYRMQRTVVEQGLADAARTALGGICCRADCVKYTCVGGCKTYTSCNTTDKGLFADVSHFQMLHIDISEVQSERYLTQVLEQEKKDTETYKQTETLTRKETEQLKMLLEYEATEIAANATADAKLLTDKADAESTAVVEEARTSGLSVLYGALNVTLEDEKKQIDYMRMLRNKENAKIYVGFSTLFANP